MGLSTMIIKYLLCITNPYYYFQIGKASPTFSFIMKFDIFTLPFLLGFAKSQDIEYITSWNYGKSSHFLLY